jgi:hypothetical protein
MSELSRFQDAFTEALTGDFARLAPWASGDQAEPRFAVYRNTVAKGCAEAIAAQFPAVARVVGEAWTREAGVRFAREHPPVRASLLDYGAGFPAWLAAFPPAADMPWLTSLARIDWAWRDACFAPDRPPLSADVLAHLAPEAYVATTTELHPAARLLWFTHGAPSLWLALQDDEAPAEVELRPEPEGLLMTRPGLEVQARLLGPGAFALLAACRAGGSLAAAGQAALDAEPDLPLGEIFAELIEAGAFAGLNPLPERAA